MDPRGGPGDASFPFRRSTVAGPSTSAAETNGRGYDPDDSFEAMRQRMDRDRDAFFEPQQTASGRPRSPWAMPRPDEGFFRVSPRSNGFSFCISEMQEESLCPCRELS